MKFEIGTNDKFEIRYESHITNIRESIRIAFLSDFHFSKKSQSIAEKMLDVLNDLNPHLILLGGDYVDTKKGFQILKYFISTLDDRFPIFAIAGNHDYFFGIKRVRSLLKSNKVSWIEKESVVVQLKNTNVQIDGNCSKIKKKGADIHINLLHNPNKITNKNYDITLAGHLHGSQIVLWKKGDMMYPGRLFYKWNLMKKELDNGWAYISKGLGDTLPIRFNCKKDMIVIDISDRNEDLKK
ncbi:MAG: metallophosphoesterase [Bacteroidota bacterium]